MEMLNESSSKRTSGKKPNVGGMFVTCLIAHLTTQSTIEMLVSLITMTNANWCGHSLTLDT